MKKHISKAAENEKVRFALIGVVNTVIDFAILNLLAHGLGLPRIPSNIASSTVAMIFSFFANRTVVFDSKDGNKRRQAIAFILVTISSIYVLQNFIIFVLSDAWLWPLETAHEIVGVLEKDVFITNVSKLVATGASLVWNFIFYKKLVFNNDQK